jgi:hypothetical protein
MARAALRTPALVAVCLVAAAALTGSAVPRQPLQLLQLNLCASGRAGCFTGRSITEADTVIRAVAPDVVTLNEVCEGDVRTLERTLADVRRGEVRSAFTAAPDRPSGEPTLCRDGQEYGIGLLAYIPPTAQGRMYTGAYPMQDPRDPEERVWLCVHATNRFYACTTHLASTNNAVALGQCSHLLTTTIPRMYARDGYDPTVVAGDFNLRYGAAPDMRPCVPSGWFRLGDGGLQHILATDDFTVRFTRWIDMRRTTDHPGLFVTLE